MSPRKIQQELDTQEIYLVTSFRKSAFARQKQDPTFDIRSLSQEEVFGRKDTNKPHQIVEMSNLEKSESLPFNELRIEVLKNLDNQVWSFETFLTLRFWI